MDLCGVQLKNPVLAASGTFAYGIEFETVADLNAIGGIVVKGLSRQAMRGNPPPRLWETTAGMLNSVGLQNIGARAFVSDKLPGLRRFKTAIFANVFGYAPEDYAEVIRILEDAEGLSGYELNVSCPNTKHGGIFFSSDAGLLGELVTLVRPLAKRPLIVKLSPNVTRIDTLAKAAEECGADGVSLVNTFVSLAVDAHTRTARLGGGYGGLSGAAIKPIALRMVHAVWKAVRIPVVGMGGICSGEDAAEFMIAGATAVEVGTASFSEPDAVCRIARELDRFARKEKLKNIGELTGTLKL